MVPYNKDKNPGLPQWAGGMQTTVVLNQPGNVSYTNLDVITGKVIVRCGKSADIDAITAKLEGESRTRLLGPTTGSATDSAKPRFEYHKILYRVQLVFPPPDVVEGRTTTTGKTTFTLPPGNHEYPFSFKLPFNNSCWNDQPMSSSMKFSADGLDVAKPPPGHVKKTLPPTLSGFAGEAEIRYYVKATVARHGFWKENSRAFVLFNFIPIEPPRPSLSGTEIFARQRHTFTSSRGTAEGTKSKMKGLFTGKEKSMDPSYEAPSIAIDARLPSPAIITCNKTIPLRLIVKKVNSSPDMVYLHSLQISLIGSTKIRAHDVYRTEATGWIILSKSNMGIPLGNASDPADTEIVLDDRMWTEQPLPNTVAPGFSTCNIERNYQLDVRVGLSSSGALYSAAKGQSIVLPLRLDTQVYSGIAPPPELLKAMADSKASNGAQPAAKPQAPSNLKLQTEGHRPSIPASPITPGGFTSATPRPAEQPDPSGMESVPQYSDAPPSYEDAIATNLPPVDAPRPDYAPPPPADDDVLRVDEKKGLHRRRDS